MRSMISHGRRHGLSILQLMPHHNPACLNRAMAPSEEWLACRQHGYVFTAHATSIASDICRQTILAAHVCLKLCMLHTSTGHMRTVLQTLYVQPSARHAWQPESHDLHVPLLSACSHSMLCTGSTWSFAFN